MADKDDILNNSKAPESLANKGRQQKELGAMIMPKGITGCVNCDRENFPVCRCSQNGSGSGDEDKDADKKIPEMLFSQDPHLKGEKYFEALVPLDKLKEFFDKKIEKLAREHLHETPEDIEKFKAEKGYSAKIQGNVLVLKLNDEELLDKFANKAFKNGMIKNLTPNVAKEIQKDLDLNKDAAKNAVPFAPPSPLDMKKLLEPKLTRAESK